MWNIAFGVLILHANSLFILTWFYI